MVVYLVTSLAAGRVGDLLGRRGTLFSGAVVFVIGGAIQTFTPGIKVMVVGRLVSGFGVGLLSYVLHPAHILIFNLPIGPLCRSTRVRYLLLIMCAFSVCIGWFTHDYSSEALWLAWNLPEIFLVTPLLL
jgi:MFS family permease